MYKHIWLFTCYTRYFQILRMSCLHWKSSRQKLPTMLLCEALWQKHHDLSTVKCQGILIAKAVMHSHTAAWMAHLDKELHSEAYGSLGASRQYFFRNAWTEFDWFIIMFTFHSFFLVKLVWHVFTLSASQSKLYFPENFLYFPKISLSSF